MNNLTHKLVLALLLAGFTQCLPAYAGDTTDNIITAASCGGGQRSLDLAIVPSVTYDNTTRLYTYRYKIDVAGTSPQPLRRLTIRSAGPFEHNLSEWDRDLAATYNYTGYFWGRYTSAMVGKGESRILSFISPSAPGVVVWVAESEPSLELSDAQRDAVLSAFGGNASAAGEAMQTASFDCPLARITPDNLDGPFLTGVTIGPAKSRSALSLLAPDPSPGTLRILIDEGEGFRLADLDLQAISARSSKRDAVPVKAASLIRQGSQVLVAVDLDSSKLDTDCSARGVVVTIPLLGSSTVLTHGAALDKPVCPMNSATYAIKR